MMFEHGLSILVSIIVIALFKMPLEGCLFFAIFIPLRSYLGGLHLKTYKSCFLLSLMTLLCILILVKLFTPAPWVSFIILALSIGVILFQVYKDYRQFSKASVYSAWLHHCTQQHYVLYRSCFCNLCYFMYYNINLCFKICRTFLYRYGIIKNHYSLLKSILLTKTAITPAIKTHKILDVK